MSLEDEPWRYRLVLGQNNQRLVIVKEEKVWRGAECLRERPDAEDKRIPDGSHRPISSR